MAKLTQEQLEILVIKRNEAGLKHTVEVMNFDELKAYKENCEEAIERQNRMIKKYKTGGSMQKIHIELKEQLEGYAAYIDAKLNEQKETESNQYMLVKINSGNAVHVAKYFESIHGVKGYEVYCGSGKTGFRNKLYKVNKEISIDNITCKKCKKTYQEMLEIK